jgi:hypothetical protein
MLDCFALSGQTGSIVSLSQGGAALGYSVEAFQASGRPGYTLMVGAEPTVIKKPATRCPECGGELECLGVGQYAMLKLRLIAAHAQAIDSS